MGQAIPLVQGLTDLPLCIDSSVIEALEAGLAAYEGKALVNSVTGEDERLEAILPLVAQHGAAVIGLANDDEIPMEPERRVDVAKKIVSAAGDHGIPPEDVVIDPLAMPVGAEPRAVTLFHRDAAAAAGRARREHDLRRLQHVVRAARAGTRLGAAFLAVAPEPRPDERDHGRAPPTRWSRPSGRPTSCSVATNGARAGSPGTGPSRRLPRREDGSDRLRGAGLHVRAIAERRGWDVEVVPLPPELHNRPEKIAPAVEGASRAIRRGSCSGTRTAGPTARSSGLPRLRGNACYDVFSRRASKKRSPSNPARIS